MAKCAFKVVNDFELLDGVHALLFDATNSNIEHQNIEILLEQPCLGLHADIIY